MTRQRELSDTAAREEFMIELLERMVRPCTPNRSKRKSTTDLLLSEGRFWVAQARPIGVSRAEAGMCFRNATHLAWADPGGLTYCEGYAFPEDLDIPIEHAWCVDQSGHVVDNTWSSPESSVYFGVPLALKYVAGVLAKKRTFGVVFDPASGRELLSKPSSSWRAASQPLHRGDAHTQRTGAGVSAMVW